MYKVISESGVLTECGRSYEEIRAALGDSMIDYVQVSDGLGLYIDDEGLLKDRPLNLPAFMCFGAYLAGPVIMVGGGITEEGYPTDVDLSDPAAERLTQMVAVMNEAHEEMLRRRDAPPMIISW